MKNPHSLLLVVAALGASISSFAQTLPLPASSPAPSSQTRTEEAESDDRRSDRDGPAPTEADTILGFASANAVTFRAEFNDEFNIRLPGDPEFARLRTEIAKRYPAPITPDQAARAFALFEKYSVSGDEYGFDSHCYARNFWWQTILRLLSIESRSAVVSMKNFPLSVIAGSLKPYGTSITWNYHIAPTVRVLDPASGRARWLVLDPALFAAPVTTTEWRRAASGMRSDFIHSKIMRASDHTLSLHDARSPEMSWWSEEKVADVAQLFDGDEYPTFRRRPMIRR